MCRSYKEGGVMSLYDKLRETEKILSEIYREGLDEENKSKIKFYFDENYGEDALVKTESTEEVKEEIVKKLRIADIPDDLDSIIKAGVKRAFEEDK